MRQGTDRRGCGVANYVSDRNVASEERDSASTVSTCLPVGVAARHAVPTAFGAAAAAAAASMGVPEALGRSLVMEVNGKVLLYCS